jgi:YggT family protein
LSTPSPPAGRRLAAAFLDAGDPRAAAVVGGAVHFQLSDWLVRPLRRIVPGVGGYDWASLIGAFLIVLAARLADFRLAFEAVLLMALQRFLEWILYGFMALLVIEAIFSWVNPHAPLAPFVRALNEPLLRPIRRVVPLVGNLDLSLLVALILLQIAQCWWGWLVRR